MRLTINDQEIEADIELVQMGTEERHGRDVPKIGYRVTKEVQGQKQTFDFLTYAECVQFLEVETNKESAVKRPFRVPVKFNAWRGKPNSLGNY